MLLMVFTKLGLSRESLAALIAGVVQPLWTVTIASEIDVGKKY
jgi:hypothetical protein